MRTHIQQLLKLGHEILADLQKDIYSATDEQLREIVRLKRSLEELQAEHNQS